MNRSIRLLIIDDHPPIRYAISALVAQEPDIEVSAEAGSAEEAFALLGRTHPDVAIVDLLLKDVHGLDLVAFINTHHPETRVLVYSMYDEFSFAERALRSGASGYVMKTEPMVRIIDAIRSVARGDIFLSSSASTYLLGKLSARNAPIVTGFDGLTDRELEVLQLVGDGCTMKDIASRLHVSYKTVETYRRRAKKKLGLSSMAELVQQAIRWRERQGRSLDSMITL